MHKYNTIQLLYCIAV